MMEGLCCSACCASACTSAGLICAACSGDTCVCPDCNNAARGEFGLPPVNCASAVGPTDASSVVNMLSCCWPLPFENNCEAICANGGVSPERNASARPLATEED